MTRHHFDQISGLFLFIDFFSLDQCDHLVQRSLDLNARLEQTVTPPPTLESVHIPQPQFVRSEKHNLGSEEFFTKTALTESNERVLRCEYFPRYGEDGHALCYFRNNHNLPDFVIKELLPPITQTILAERFVESAEELTWKLTMNFYRNVNGKIAGFPFHVDIPANGVVTMIINVHREVLFQIAKADVMQNIELPIGSLLILSGESRYEWKHRVLPCESPPSADPNMIERVSLVLGFQ